MIRKLLSILTVSMMLSGLATAATDAQETAGAPDRLSETYGAWTLRCGQAEGNCHVSQSFYRATDKARLLQVSMFKPSNGDGGMVLRTLTPLGAILESGVELIIDGGSAQKAKYISCWPKGCLAEMPLPQGMQRAMRAGEVLAVQLKSAETGQTIRMELSLKGVSAALNRFGEM